MAIQQTQGGSAHTTRGLKNTSGFCTFFYFVKVTRLLASLRAKRVHIVCDRPPRWEAHEARILDDFVRGRAPGVNRQCKFDKGRVPPVLPGIIFLNPPQLLVVQKFDVLRQPPLGFAELCKHAFGIRMVVEQALIDHVF